MLTLESEPNYFIRNKKIQNFLKNLSEKASSELFRKQLAKFEKKDYLRFLDRDYSSLFSSASKMISNMDTELAILEKRKSEITKGEYPTQIDNENEGIFEQLKLLRKEVKELRLKTEKDGKIINSIEEDQGPIVLKQIEDTYKEFVIIQKKNEAIKSKMKEVERYEEEVIHKNKKKSEVYNELIEKLGIKTIPNEKIIAQYKTLRKKIESTNRQLEFLKDRDKKFDEKEKKNGEKIEKNLAEAQNKIDLLQEKLNKLVNK